jgi:peptidoglycan/xylan/chitin deacetylase (PgdA/CDA1 family)
MTVEDGAVLETPRAGSRRVLLASVTHAWLRKRLVALAYHEVRDLDLFRRQVEYLRATRNPVSIGDVLRAQAGERPLPARPVLVTFDDGHRSVYEKGLPILHEYGIPSLVFAVADHIGTDRPFWFNEVRELLGRGVVLRGTSLGSPDQAIRYLKQVSDEERRQIVARLRESAGEEIVQPQLRPEELREMQDAGMEIGNHTCSHPCLDRCSDRVLEDELIRAHESLTTWLGHPPRVFAYPNGNGDGRAEAVLDRLGYEAAFLFDHRIAPFPAANPLRISRVRVNTTTPMLRFRNIINGLHPFVHHALGRR